MKTSGEFSYSWRVLIASRRFSLPPVQEMVPLGAALFGGAIDEDWALIYTNLSLLGHSLMKSPS